MVITDFDDVFDESGVETPHDATKLQIGDFINYDAGNWTKEEYSKITIPNAASSQFDQTVKHIDLNGKSTTTKHKTVAQVPLSLTFNKSLKMKKITAVTEKEVMSETGEVIIERTETVSSTSSTPNTQFGGIDVGDSRNNAINTYKTYKGLKDTEGNDINGWRLFHLEEDGTMYLISAGCPENYYLKSVSNGAYISEYIMSGNVNSSASSSLKLPTVYTKRDWSSYINSAQGATEARCMTLDDIKNWLNTYKGGDGTINYNDLYNAVKLSDLLGEKRYKSLIDNGTYYYLATAYNSNSMWFINGKEGKLKYGYRGDASPYGVRIIVKLDKSVKVSAKPKGTVNLSDGNTYNSWDIYY